MKRGSRRTKKKTGRIAQKTKNRLARQMKCRNPLQAHAARLAAHIAGQRISLLSPAGSARVARTAEALPFLASHQE
jgi:hypothetical protein